MDKIDDKALVIACATLIMLFAMFAVPDAQNLISQGITGLFGVAVGRVSNNGR